MRDFLDRTGDVNLTTFRTAIREAWLIRLQFKLLTSKRRRLEWEMPWQLQFYNSPGLCERIPRLSCDRIRARLFLLLFLPPINPPSALVAWSAALLPVAPPSWDFAAPVMADLAIAPVSGMNFGSDVVPWIANGTVIGPPPPVDFNPGTPPVMAAGVHARHHVEV